MATDLEKIRNFAYSYQADKNVKRHVLFVFVSAPPLTWPKRVLNCSAVGMVMALIPLYSRMIFRWVVVIFGIGLAACVVELTDIMA